MPNSKEDFAVQLKELATRFDRDSADMRRTKYDEATLRLEYLDPMFAALGWNVWNKPVQSKPH